MALENQWIVRGQRFKKAREAKGLYLKDVAKIINKSVSALSDFEQGRKRLGFDDLKTLCIFFDIDIRTI